MIFGLYPRVAVKLGDERHEFELGKLMFAEAAQLEEVSGQSYLDWQSDLIAHKITAIAALLHVLRKRDGQPSQWPPVFAAGDLDVVPLHDDGSEWSADEVTEDLQRRFAAAKAEAEPVPTLAANGQASPSAAAASPKPRRTSQRSRTSTASGRGSGSGSPTGSS